MEVCLLVNNWVGYIDYMIWFDSFLHRSLKEPRLEIEFNWKEFNKRKGL